MPQKDQENFEKSGLYVTIVCRILVTFRFAII